MVPEISVIMPVFNSINTLPRSIESILNQTFRDFEFIIVNDYGSDDGSQECIRDYETYDKRISFLQATKRMGLAASLNLGMRLAKGKYVARMDADDYSYPNRLQVEWDYMEAHPDCVLCGSEVRRISPSGNRHVLFDTNFQDIRAGLLFSCRLCHPTVLFRRKYFVDHKYFYRSKYVCEDFDLWTRIEGNYYIIPEVLLDYYFDNNNTSVRLRDKVFRDSLAIVENQLRSRLNIDTRLYHKRWFWPDLYEKDYMQAEDIGNCYQFLSMVEKQNKILNYCSEDSMTRILISRWNMYLCKYFVLYGDTAELSIPWLHLIPNHNFSLTLSEFLRSTALDNEIVLKQRWAAILREMNSLRGCKCVVFGVGESARTFFEKEPNNLRFVSVFCDNNPSWRGKTFAGVPVIEPMELNSVNYDFIIISSFKYYNEIRQQLLTECCISPKKIFSLGIFNYL